MFFNVFSTFNFSCFISSDKLFSDEETWVVKLRDMDIARRIMVRINGQNRSHSPK